MNSPDKPTKQGRMGKPASDLLVRQHAFPRRSRCRLLATGIFLPVLWGFLSAIPNLQAESSVAAPPPEAITTKASESFFDKLWGLASLYKNDDNSFIQEIKLRGRYHGQYHWTDATQGYDNGWEDRRSRFGIDAKLFHKTVELRFDVQGSDEFNPFYNGIADAYIKWKPSSAFSLAIGKLQPAFGRFDWIGSSNTMPTLERSQIFNQLRIDRVTGILAEGQIGDFLYQTGIYSNDVDLEFGQFEGGVVLGAGIGYNLTNLLDADKASLWLEYLYSDITPGSKLLNRYENLFSLTFQFDKALFGFVAEGFAGLGGPFPDAAGFYLLGTYDILPEKLQLVARYSFSKGDGPDSLIAQGRYERTLPLTDGGRGESYHAFYFGSQYFIYGDKLKLMLGAEYATLEGGGDGGDYDGWTVLTGVRVSF